MLLAKMIRKSLPLAIVLLLSVACNEAEFYEKKYLDGVGVANEDNPTDLTIPSDDDRTTGGSVDNSDNGSNNDPSNNSTGSSDNSDSNTSGGGTDQGSGSTGGNSDSGSSGSGNTDTGNTDNGSGNTDTDNGSGNTDTGNTNPGDGNTNPGDGNTNPGDGNTDPGDGDNSTDPVVEGPELLDKLNEFTQNKAKEAAVDILWVVDDSGSMSDEQKALAYNFDIFIHEFLTKKVDFQMFITTTDATSRKNGRMVGAPGLLTSEAAKRNEKKFMSDFSKLIKVGTRGSGREKGIQTSLSFIDRYSKAHLRKDAYLIVVYVSDEEDQSQKKVDEYLKSIQSHKENAGLVKMYSIVTKEKSSSRWETIGSRYMEASEKTGGTSAHIKKDFYSILRDMGGKIVDLTDSFALSGTPYNNLIEVKVDGKIVSTGWSYDANSRTLKFSKDSVPNEGALIKVSYKEEQTKS